jgi:hypothetical protein
MMRVEISMDDSVRGLVAKYASETDKTMPEAYKDLIINGLVISEVDFPTFSPDVNIDEDALKINRMDEEEYEITMADGE